MVSGPAEVVIGDVARPTTTATFTVPGTYVLRLNTTDGTSTASDRQTITIIPPNVAPSVSAGEDLVLHPPDLDTPLVGNVTDDGKPTGSVFTAHWSQAAGPGPVNFSTTDQASTVVTFPIAGRYVLRLVGSDGDDFASAEVTVTVLGSTRMNSPPQVQAGPDRFVAPPDDRILLEGKVTDDGLPVGSALTVGWELRSGPGAVSFSTPTRATTEAQFAGPGVYVLRLTASDSAAVSSDDLVVSVSAPRVNQPPFVDAGPDRRLTPPALSLSLDAVVGDDGLPVGHRLEVAWQQVSGPAPVTFGDSTQSRTIITLVASGTYVLRLNASDGATVASDQVTIVVEPGNFRPRVSAGQDQTVTVPDRAVTLAGAVTDDGLPAGAPVTSRWSLVSGPGTVVFASARSPSTVATFDAPGTYVLRLTAHDTALSASDDVVITVNGLPPTGSAPTVAITAPGDLSNVTAPIDVRGTVASASLLAWRLEYQEKSLGDEWRTIARGDTPVTDAILGQFDPTLLLNGLYQLRLVATDRSGRTATTPLDEPTLKVRGNFKVGQFTLSFLELSIPVSGIPIQLLRNYDSRDTVRKGDFGYGWTLEATGVRVSESGKMGRSWQIVRTPDFFPTFCIQPVRGKRVTVAIAGGRTYEFEAVAEDACETSSQPSLATIGFRALPGTNATLATQDQQSVLFQEGQLLDANGAIYDPHSYVLTLLNGTQMLVSDRTGPDGAGLKSVTDTNGNSVTFTRGGITHSAGTALTINRDAEGRISSIVDPMGKVYSYSYDVEGNLASATDPVGNVTQFRYETELLHHLRDIIDPRGLRAARNDYEDGRLVSTTDAAGKVIAYTHDIASRREVVLSRTGDQTIFEYDVRGNVTREVDAEGGVTLRTFDANDNVLTRTDPNNHTWRYTYNDRDLETSITDPLGKTTTKTYTATLGKLRTETDPLNHTTTTGYDLFGNVVESIDALQNTTKYLYSPQGDLRAVIDAPKHATSYQYDRNGFLTVSRDRFDHLTTYTNDSSGRRLTETRTRTTPSGTETLVTRFVYDDNGRVVETHQPDGSILRTTFNAIGKVATTVDALGRTTSMTYDDLGQLIQTTYPDTSFEETAYDDSGRRIATRDAAGRTTSYEYDRLGRLVKTTFPDATFTTAAYDPGGRQTSATDARGKVTTFGYDNAGRRTTVTDPLAHTVTYGYDDAGRNTTIRDARGFTTSFTYDAANRKTGTTFPDTTQTTTGYDDLGRRTSETDQAGRTTTYGYDLEGRLVRVTDALTQVTTYAYDQVGNRINQIDANNHETRFEYDKLGRQTRRVLPDGKFETKTYDPQGRMTSRTDFMGRTTTFQYDQRDRLTLKTYPDSTKVSFTYTATGGRLTAVDARGTTSYTYDQRDRPTQLTYPDGRRLNYGYDAEGNRTSLIATLGATSLTSTFTYDDRDQVATVTDPDGRVYTYGYNPNGSPTSLAQPNGVTTTYTYDSLSRLTNLVSRRGTTTLASYAYTLGLTGVRDRIDEANGISRSYGFDPVYRLTSETVTAWGASEYAKTFTYDHVGNRLAQVTSGAANLAYTYDKRDRMLTAGGTTLSWDDNGNLAARSDGDSYVWDFDDRLVRVTKADGTTVDHVYDVDGNRVSTTVTPAGAGAAVVTSYLVDTMLGLSHVVADTDASGAIGAYYVRAADDLLAVTRASAVACYLKDGLGSVRGLADGTGALTDTLTYSAFGERLAVTGSDPQPYRFAGEPFETVSGLSYNRARWLDLVAGTFIGIDPHPDRIGIPNTHHSYGYAADNPVLLTDPSGRSYTLSGLAAVSAVSAAINIAIVQPRDFRGLMKAAVTGATVGAAAYTGLAAVEILAAKFIATATGTTAAAGAATVLTAAERIYENSYTGKAFELALAEKFRDLGYRVVMQEVHNTPFGRRLYDLVVYRGSERLGAIEAKVGNAVYDNAQRLKDEFLLLTKGLWTNVVRVPQWPPQL